jgi:hypothetical protein
VLEQELQGPSSAVAASGKGQGQQAGRMAFPIDTKDYHNHRTGASGSSNMHQTNGSSSGGGSSSSSSSRGANNLHSNGKSTSGLTLLRLRAWMQDPIERMSLMARLVDSAGPFRGGALVSRLHAHSLHGDPAACALVKRVMYSVCGPLYIMLTRWLLQGELHDPHNEFFIGTNHSTFNPSSSSWQHLYFLRPSMLPSFLEQSIAEKILVIGKSINFIKLCQQKMPKDSPSNESNTKASKSYKGYRQINKSKVLGLYGQVVDRADPGTAVPLHGRDGEHSDESDDDDWSRSGQDGVTSSKPLQGAQPDNTGVPSQQQLEESLKGLRYGGEAQLADVVSSILSSTDARLLNLMESRFHITTHLLALKKFLLLGQGDFVTCLMDSVGPELKKRANQQYRHNLTGLLEGALRASNAQYEQPWVLDRVGGAVARGLTWRLRMGGF